MIVLNETFTKEVTTNSSDEELLWQATTMDFFIYSFSFLFGFPTHCYVSWLIISGTGSGVAAELFNLNLSVCEISICLNAFLSLIYYSAKLVRLTRLILFSLGPLITGRPLFQCVICVERYLAVVHPVTFLKYKPLRYRLICCAPVWIITLSSCLCCMLSLDYFQNYTDYYFTQYIVFLAIQLFCLMAVFKALKHSGPGEGKIEKKENLLKRRAFNLILITTLSLFVGYMPMIVAGIAFLLKQTLSVYFFSVGYLCFAFGGFVQPVLYLHQNGKISFPCFAPKKS